MPLERNTAAILTIRTGQSNHPIMKAQDLFEPQPYWCTHCHVRVDP